MAQLINPVPEGLIFSFDNYIVAIEIPDVAAYVKNRDLTVLCLTLIMPPVVNRKKRP